MNIPKISVVIPIWNGERTIEATIRSCLNQTMEPIEILVCDDGSTDNSKKIVESIGNSKVTWIAGNHSGSPAGPRNRGLALSKGDWIAFCDSDDEWIPTKLEKQMSLVQELNCKATCTGALTKKSGVISDTRVSTWKKEIISFNDLLKSNNVVCSSVIINLSIFKEIGGFTDIIEYASFADYIYWLRVSTKTNFAYVNESLVIYDDHPETSLRSLFTDGRLLREKALNNFVIWAKTKNMTYYILKAKIRLILEWVKKSLYDKIKLCFYKKS